MRALPALLFSLAVTAAAPDLRYFRHVRQATVTPASGQACIALDASLFAAAAPGLADLRLYREQQETPYLVQIASPAETPEQAIQLLNLGTQGAQMVFDASMPGGIYSDLLLDVKGQDFIATVTVTGSREQAGPATRIGDYTIFDLTHQRLGRGTVLHLPASDFRYLHFRIAGPLRPNDIGGLSIPRLSAGEPAYTLVAESKQVSLKDHSSILEFTVPAHVPVDRIVVAARTSPVNFSRDAVIQVRSMAPSPAGGANEPPAPVSSQGNLLRVHTVQDGHRIDQERLTLDAPYPTTEFPSKWTVSIDNGDDAPLIPASVRLEMVRRDLCFESSGGNYALYYGDAKLNPPRYDLGKFIVVRAKGAAQVALGPEQANPNYQPRPDDRPFTEKHPLLLWIALALVIVVLGAIALRTAKNAQPQQS